MKKGLSTLNILFIILGILIFITIILSLSNSEDKKNNTPIKLNNPSNNNVNTLSKNWNFKKSFTGSNSQNTDTFNIQGEKFKVKYKIEGDPEFGLIVLNVYKEGESFPLEIMTIDLSNSENIGESIIYSGKNNYYLDINAANIDNWKIEIEDYY